MNTNGLKIAMLKRGDNKFIEKIAKITGVDSTTASKKMKFGTFKQTEIKKLVKYYDLTSDEIKDIFFNSEDCVNDS